MASNKQLELAEAQFTGFVHAQYGYDVESLVKSMGLTASEWGKIRDRNIVMLRAADVVVLDEYFGRKGSERK